MPAHIIGLIIASLFFIVGIAGTVIPLLPGPVLIWAGMLLYGLITGFENLSVPFFIVQGLAVLLIAGIDYLTTALGTRYFGGSRAAFWGAALGLVAGIMIFNLPGLLIGPFAGAVTAELFATRNFKRSLVSGIGAVLGFLVGIPVKIFIEIVMIAWFLVIVL